MKFVIGILCLLACLVVFTSLRQGSNIKRGVEPAIARFKTEATGFALTTSELALAIDLLDRKRPLTLRKAREALRSCRLRYKRIEFFLDYFFASAALIYNGPAKIEIEEPYMEFQEPIGLQVIEGLLFEKNPYALKEQLRQQADAISTSAVDLGSLLYAFSADDRQLLESVRIHLLKLITLGITGFDAPYLKTGIAEAESSLGTLQAVIAPFINNDNKEDIILDSLFGQSIRYLRSNGGFDNFNRLFFLKTYALPLQHQLGMAINRWGLYLNSSNGVLNYEAQDIFSPDALNLEAFTQNKTFGNKKELIELGKKLFSETALSGNNLISCATCHRPENYFTESVSKSTAFDGHSFVQRNAATLLYSGFQYEQFWDGRAKSLEEQIITVINNPGEMNSGAASGTLSVRLPKYAASFRKAFGETGDTLTAINKVAHAIAAYIRELNPRNSRFDRYLHGPDNMLTFSEKRGFNLFMGKAQCGTCHFAPLFNGLVPPYYNISELEVLGTLATDDMTRPRLDKDRGRAVVFPIEYYEGAFKTPTVRNASATGPYMHNGAFRTLENVVEFYNKGGAAGLGVPIANQTLSAQPLNLSRQEVKDVVNFLNALKDSIEITTTEY
ncbi:MAG: cytochrome c peroxidase [Chitinophagaceae bacterium]